MTSPDNPQERLRAPDDFSFMGTPVEARTALIEAARTWRNYRQPSIATRAEHKKQELLEREARFQLANAALLWLWHEENPAASRSIPAGEDAELVHRLRIPMLDEKRMEQWDALRASIARGNKGSWPRDVIESWLDSADQDRNDAAARLSSQSARIAYLEARLEKAEEVIRPFAKMADAMDGSGARRVVIGLFGYAPVSAFRAARRWIEGGE